MKKILLTSIAVAGYCASAFGQDTILFENADNSSAFVTLNSAAGPKTGSGLIVELFWENPANSQFILEDTFTSTFTGNGSGNPPQLPGQFNAGAVTIPDAGTQTFEIEGFYPNSFGPYLGTTGPFTATVNTGSSFPVTTDSGSWNGNLTLIIPPGPEPSTIALGSLGAAVLLLFRRRK